MTALSRPLRVVARPGHPDFLDLPWGLPLEDWEHARLVEVARGLHRHVVRFVDYDGALYALKQMPTRLAQREYRLLRELAEEGLPVVDVVGVVTRTGLEDVLITRYLDYSLPYRTLFMHRRTDSTQLPDTARARTLTDRLLDALAVLLVRLHLLGFFWGDCSLSNVLFRRDAGSLAAYVVDVETGERHPRLTSGQRRTDLEITQLNVAGGLLDLQAQLDLPPDPDPLDTAEDLIRRYDALWEELTSQEIVSTDARHELESRMRRLNELGFDVDEVELVTVEDGQRLVFTPVVTEQGHHRRKLLTLTGLEAQENQARSLLNDLANFRLALEGEAGRTVPETVVAHRWLSEVFEPTVAAVPQALHSKLEAAELFHEVIEHKWFLSEQADEDVGIDKAVRSYLANVLPAAPDERTVLPD